MIKIDKIEDLKGIDKAVRKVITAHLKKTGQSPTNFAKEVDIHPLQMLSYINKGTNFRFDTLMRIGKNVKKSG